MTHQLGLAQTDSEITRCFSVMQELRPHLLASEFVELVRRQQQDGYQLLYLTPASEQPMTEQFPAAVAGFRILENLSSGRFLYVDDLVTTSAARSRGYGEALMDWLMNHARQQQCQSIQLDSGVQRFDAHRFYFRQRLAITCYRFESSL